MFYHPGYNELPLRENKPNPFHTRTLLDKRNEQAE